MNYFVKFLVISFLFSGSLSLCAEDGPFNVFWLSNNLGLDVMKVASFKADPSEHFVDIEFTNSIEAKKFYNNLENLSCPGVSCNR